MASRGGDAYWAWDSPGGCKLADRVKLTFAAVSPPRPTAAQLEPSACGTSPSLPPCRAAAEAEKPLEPFLRWSSHAYSLCADREASGRPRDYCARSVLDQAVDSKRVSAAAVQACLTASARGSQTAGDYIAAYRCIEHGAIIEQARGSTVLQAAAAKAPAALPRNVGYKRPDIMAGLQAADWPYMPLREGDGNYYLNAFAKLAAACPSAEIEATALQMTQIAMSNLNESMRRAASGQGTLEDLNRLLFAGGQMLKAAQDCNKQQSSYIPGRYDACVAERDSAFELPPSVDARHDLDVLLRQHRCDSPETRIFARHLSAWLVMAPHRRAAMSWSTVEPRVAEFRSIFENCRRQAGGGVADAWCGCYVRKYGSTSPRGYYNRPEAMALVKTSAFVGGGGMNFEPSDIDECEAGRKDIDLWRQSQRAAPVPTACLVSQEPVADAIAPDLKACRYRTAWGQIEVRMPQCRLTWQSHQWGGEAIKCQ